MTDVSRWRTPLDVRRVIDQELAAARTASDPWPALERAHIASQPWAWPHLRVHTAMLRTALVKRDRREAFGQAIRLAVAGPGSLVGRYPPGNTGRATMSLTATAPLPDDLKQLLEPYTTG